MIGNTTTTCGDPRLSELIRAKDFDAIFDMRDMLDRIAGGFRSVSEHHYLQRKIERATLEGRGCKRDAERLLTAQRILDTDGIDPVTGEIGEHTWMPEDDEEDVEEAA